MVSQIIIYYTRKELVRYRKVLVSMWSSVVAEVDAILVGLLINATTPYSASTFLWLLEMVSEDKSILLSPRMKYFLLASFRFAEESLKQSQNGCSLELG